MSKGSKRRPGTITDEQWARTFGSDDAEARLASARQRSAENRARRGSDWTPPGGHQAGMKEKRGISWPMLGVEIGPYDEADAERDADQAT